MRLIQVKKHPDYLELRFDVSDAPPHSAFRVEIHEGEREYYQTYQYEKNRLIVKISCRKDKSVNIQLFVIQNGKRVFQQRIIVHRAIPLEMVKEHEPTKINPVPIEKTVKEDERVLLEVKKEEIDVPIKEMIATDDIFFDLKGIAFAAKTIILGE